VLLVLLTRVDGGSLDFGGLVLHGVEVSIQLLFGSVAHAHHLGDAFKLGGVFHLNVLEVDVASEQVAELRGLLRGLGVVRVLVLFVFLLGRRSQLEAVLPHYFWLGSLGLGGVEHEDLARLRDLRLRGSVYAQRLALTWLYCLLEPVAHLRLARGAPLLHSCRRHLVRIHSGRVLRPFQNHVLLPAIHHVYGDRLVGHRELVVRCPGALEVHAPDRDRDLTASWPGPGRGLRALFLGALH
jgi:hypothetical protein